MKKLLFVLIVFSINAQEFRIFEMDNGLPKMFPSTIIKQEGNTINIYESNNGLPSMFPSTIIKQEDNRITVFETTNGLPHLLPSKIIDVVTDKPNNIDKRDYYPYNILDLPKPMQHNSPPLRW